MLNCDSHHKPCPNFISDVHQPAGFSELAEWCVPSHKAIRKEVITNDLAIYWDFQSICWFKPLKIQSVTLQWSGMVIFSNISYFWFYVLECRTFQTTVVNGDIAVGRELSQSGPSKWTDLFHITVLSVSRDNRQSSLSWSPGALQDSAEISAGCLASRVLESCQPKWTLWWELEIQICHIRIWCIEIPLLLGPGCKDPQQNISRKEATHPERCKCNYSCTGITFRESPQRSSFLHMTGLIYNSLFYLW